MVIWVALAAAGGMALLSLRSVAFAFAHTVDARPERPRALAAAPEGRFSRRQAAMLVVEIGMSLGIALTIVGLAAAAALPGRLLVGALLAQVAVLCALLAPATAVRCGGVRLRPAALALGVAQLAHVAFFLKALQALL